MIRRIWAAFERIIPRGLQATTTIVVAAVTNPHAIGLYSWAALALTLSIALTDAPIRHVAVISIRTSAGRNFLRRYTILAGSLGFLFMTAALWGIADVFGRSAPAADFLSLAPLVFVPPAQAMAVRHTAMFQHEGLWGRISLIRVAAAITGAAIGVPIALASKSIVGACITYMTSEIVYTVIICLWSARIQAQFPERTLKSTPNADHGDRPVSSWSTYRHIALYNFLGWLQGQAERGLLGIWAGTSALGTYSIGYAIGRSAGDAIVASQPHVLRVDLSRSGAQSDHEIRTILSRNLRGGLFLTVGSAIAVVIISVYVLPPFLGPSWSTALQMGPILALTAIPLAVAASSAPVHIQRGKARIAYIAPAITLLFAPLVAIMAIKSLTIAAWIVLLRECVLAIIQSLLMGKATPWREVGLALLVVALGSLAVMAI